MEVRRVIEDGRRLRQGKVDQWGTDGWRLRQTEDKRVEVERGRTDRWRLRQVETGEG